MDIIDYLPQKMKAEAEAYMPCGLEEIRVRAGKQVQYMFAGGCRAGVYISHSDIEEMINYLSGYSFHAIAPQLAAGYFTVEGGHRVGIAGQMGCDGERVTAVSEIASLNIRIAHQIKGVAMPLMPYIRDENSIYNTLVVSRPGEGKTTFLRDCIRILSDGCDGKNALKVSVVDERSEIAACYNGVAQNDVGKSSDVLDNCPKSLGMRMLLRSMSPDVIAVDELGGESDIEALNQLVSCGIRILGSVHGTNADDLRRKMLPHAIERFVFIDHDEKGVRRYSIYDEAYRLLYSTVCGIGADKRLQQKKKGRYSDAV